VVTALVAVCPAMDRWLFGPRDLAAGIRARMRRGRESDLGTYILRGLQHAVSTSITAWAASAPLLAYHYGSLYTYGAVATLLILPVATIALALGFCKLLLGFVWPSAGAVLAAPASVTAGWMSDLAGWFGSWPGACISVAPPPVWLMIGYYGLLLLWSWMDRRQQRALACLLAGSRGSPAEVIEQIAPQPKIQEKVQAAILRQIRPIPTRMIVLAVAGVGGAYWLGTRPAELPESPRVHVLAVGDGLAVVVRSPAGGVLLYDCGSISVSGVAERIVVPCLRNLGIRRIDAVVLSHPNLDHYSGVSHLARTIPVGQVWVGEAFRDAGGLPRQLLKELAGLGVPVQPISKGHMIPSLAPLTAAVMWPAGDEARSLSDNDSSVVLQIEGMGARLLLTGDIGPKVQERLAAEAAKAVRADVLVLPHHGRGSTISKGFLEAVGARVAIASTADPSRNSGFEAAAGPTATVMDTRSCGMITVDLTPDGPRVRQFRQDR